MPSTPQTGAVATVADLGADEQTDDRDGHHVDATLDGLAHGPDGALR